MKQWLTLLFKKVLFAGRPSFRNRIAPGFAYDKTRFLIITADDFGASKNINEGIKLAADKRVITSISALINFSGSLPELKEISKAHPDIGIGVHLNITTGKPILPSSRVPSLVNATGNFYTIDDLLPILGNISLAELRDELKAQISALADSGIRIDHLSDHNGILSFYSPFFNIVTELAMEFKTPVRAPVIGSIKYPQLFPNSRMNASGHQRAMKLAIRKPLKALRLLRFTRIQEIVKKIQILDKLGVLHPDLLIDYFWGNPTISNYKYILEHLPPGCSELILHLGTDIRQENYPSGLDQEYFTNREHELSVVTAKFLNEYYNSLNIKIIGYTDIMKMRATQNLGPEN